jgi:cell division protein FtsW
MEIFRKFGFDKPLFFIILAILCYGLVMVFSSSVILADEKYDEPFFFFINQLIGVALGIVLAFLILTVKFPFYQNKYFIIGLLILSVLLLTLCLLLPSFGPTKRWLYFLGFRFQPTELAKLSSILFFAYYLDRNQNRLKEIQTLLVPLGIIFLFIFLIIKEPDHSTALIIFIISIVMLFIGGVKFKFFLFTGVTSLAFIAFSMIRSTYALNRIFTFLSPDRDPLGSGFQALQSKLAVGSGGIFGVSLGESTQKLFFLPCAHTDYIYAIIGEELGILGTVSVLLLFGLFLWRGLIVSWKAPNTFCRLAAAGITFAIFFQAMLNISIVLGLGPPTGLPLPLFSFGRSSLITTIFGIAILLHISQRKRNDRI